MSNRLADETSPYLQQHAENPVHWYPWGSEALSQAREQNKPILLSIGYSACHWCHVMAHESFEDEATASIMNRHFVNIKVDREERPDIDQIYQTAHYMLTQRSGGWPLTMFLTPDGKPFFGGTYFPKTARYNLPGFGDLLQQIARLYIERRDDIDEQNSRLLEALEDTLPSRSETSPTLGKHPIEQAMAGLRASFDQQYGGFGRAPKFPHPTDLALSLRQYAIDGDANALRMPVFTLEKMARGGIYDQLGGGFCRYSVDQEWMIPHFEKMLYDNGPLLGLITDAWLVTKNPLFERVANETATWVMREMQSSEGGYYSTLDADSEGHEGKFYVWTPSDIEPLLTPTEYQVVALSYGLDGSPNFEHTHWHLRIVRDIDAVAQQTGLSTEETSALLASARLKLFSQREKRVRPGRDEKILTSWNGLMIQGMARAGYVFDRPEWIASARRALNFICATMWKDNRLLATYKDGKAHLNAYLDDYAFMLAALLELMQADYQKDDLRFATQLADVLLDQFEDKQDGGFFFTSHNHEALIHRPKNGNDNATPSGNGVAAFTLTRLAHLTGETKYSTAAEQTLRLFYEELEQQPFGSASLLMALEENLSPPRLIVIRGPEEDLMPWRQFLRWQYQPTTQVFFIPNNVTDLPDILAKPANTHVNAWVCQGVSCLPPIDNLAQLEAVLQSPGID